jgi:hypothetical protein
MRSVLNQSCRENQNTYFMFSNLVSENHAVDEIMSKNLVEPQKFKTTIRRMRVACLIIKATRAQAYAFATHSQKCVIRTVFLLEQWLRERASLLGYTYITPLVVKCCRNEIKVVEEYCWAITEVVICV